MMKSGKEVKEGGQPEVKGKGRRRKWMVPSFSCSPWLVGSRIDSRMEGDQDMLLLIFFCKPWPVSNVEWYPRI